MRHFLAAAVTALTATPALAQDLLFTLVNDSSQTIVEMYLAPSVDPSWGDNILMGPLEPGAVADVSVADGETVCEYDMYYVSAEGGEAEDTQNLCELGTYTLTD